MPAWLTLKVATYIGAGLAALALIGGYMLWLHNHTKAAIAADRNAANAAAVATARQADERAHAAAVATSGAIQQENDRARQAAATDDDPLRAGFDSLRQSSARRTGEATR